MESSIAAEVTSSTEEQTFVAGQGAEEAPDSFIESQMTAQVNSVFGRSTRLPAGLSLDRDSSFFETKLDIKREMEERNKREFDVWGKETYLNAIKQSNLIPMNIALRQLPTEELNLSHRIIDAQDLRPLCLSLHTNANISTLKLDDNAIGIEGAKWLLTALKENVAVRELSLADNHLGNAVCALVAELLAINRNLISINLSGNSLDDRAGRDVGAILEVTFTLKSLNLSRNKLSDLAADEIANSLRYNDSIETFSLEWNNFMPLGCRLVFNGLKKNLGVRHFMFSANGTDDSCAMNIAEMLQSNHVLSKLDLASSRLSDKSTPILIGQGLSKNDALEEINLDANLLSETSLLQFLDFIRTSSNCPPLKKVYLRTVPIKSRTAESLGEMKEERADACVILAGPVVSGSTIRGMKTPGSTPRSSIETNNADENTAVSQHPEPPVSEANVTNEHNTPAPCSRQSSALVSS